MKTTKRILLFWIATAMAVFCLGCGQKPSNTDIDLAALGNELLQNAEFEDELSAVDDSVIQKVYEMDTYVNAQVYMSSGATAEEIALFEFEDSKAAGEGFKQVKTHLENQKEDFSTYIPKEVQKLERGVVKQSGKYVLVCISNGDKAEAIITDFINR